MIHMNNLGVEMLDGIPIGKTVGGVEIVDLNLYRKARNLIRRALGEETDLAIYTDNKKGSVVIPLSNYYSQCKNEHRE